MTDNNVKELVIHPAAWDAVRAVLEREFPKFEIVKFPTSFQEDGIDSYMFNLKDIS